MREDLLRRRDAHAHEHRRPVHRVEPQDVLAHDVHRVLPERAVQSTLLLLGLGPPQHRQVVRQRVDPDVHHMLVVVGNGDAPGEAGPGHAQILEALLDKAEHFISPRRRLQEIRIGLVVVQQRLRKLGELEKVTRLLGPPLHHAAARSALLAVHFDQLGLRVERLVADAVPALVGALVNEALRQQALPHLLDSLLVLRRRGAHEHVVAQAEGPLELLETLAHFVAELLRRDAALLRALLHLLAVLVRAGGEARGPLVQPAEPRHRVRGDACVCVAHMRDVVHVEDRRRHEPRRRSVS
mmetsp:Transcript_1985/g.8755  ORF Transcript_1985/g.8755 Transcript_1985/m.8755 type:complete len:297 (-) Transcript_1985:20-910(-)